MDGAILPGIISGGVIVMTVAFTYGRLSQKVDDLRLRIGRIEKMIDRAPFSPDPPARL